MTCCTNDCCGPGSYCCSHANPHTHDDPDSCLAEYGDELDIAFHGETPETSSPPLLGLPFLTVIREVRALRMDGEHGSGSVRDMSYDETFRLIEAFCREVIETEDEQGYDVRGVANRVLDLIAALKCDAPSTSGDSVFRSGGQIKQYPPRPIVGIGLADER